MLQQIKKLCSGKHFRHILPVLFFAGAALLIMGDAASSPLNRMGASNFDNFVFKYVGRVILNGGMPYTDVFDHKGPVMYLINALGLGIGAETGLWLVEILFCFGSMIFAYRTLRLMKVDPPEAVFGVTLAFLSLRKVLDHGNFTEEYAIFFQMLAIYCFTDYLISRRLSRLRVFLAGAAFACVLLLRENLVAIWVPCVLTLLIHMIIRKDWKSVGTCTLFFILGILTVCVPIGLWLWIRGAFTEFIRDYWTFNLIYSAGHGTMSFTEILVDCCSWCPLFPAGLALSALTTVFAWQREKELLTASLMNLLGFVFSVIIICLPGIPYPHYSMMLVPCLVMPFGLAACFLKRMLRGRVIWVLRLAGLAAVIGALTVTSLSAIRTVWATDNLSQTAAEVYLKKWVRKGERLLTVGENSVEVYNRTGTFFPGKYVYCPPQMTDEMKEEYAEWVESILQDPPEYLVSPLVMVHEFYYLETDPYFSSMASLYSPVRIQDNQVIYIRADYFSQTVLYQEENQAN